MEREILAMRCLTLEGGRTVDMYYWRIEHLREAGKSDKEISNDEEVRHWNKLADLLTPVSKYYCSEMCNRIAYDALQIHGGSGFTEDYDIARIYRDARIITIYDGNTNLGGQDAFLMKINSLGTRQWTTLLGTSSDDFAYSVATDDSGNIYVVGITNGNLNGNVNAGGSDIFLTKYDSSGNLLWTRLIGTAGDDSSSGIVIDKSQNIYISGYVTGGLSGNTQLGGSDAVILKYDSSGNQIWSRQIGGTNDDIFRYIVIDPENNLILTGSSNSSTLDGNTNAGGYDILLAKYDLNGQKLLVKLYGTANNDYSFSLSNGLNKNIFISGQTDGAFAANTSKGKFDMFVMPLTTNGNCFLTK